MKKLSLVLCATMLAGIGGKAMAQVQDVSFTVAPVVGYTHWDSKLNLGDSPFWGVRAGFGFGPSLRSAGSMSVALTSRASSRTIPRLPHGFSTGLTSSKTLT